MWAKSYLGRFHLFEEAQARVRPAESGAGTGDIGVRPGSGPDPVEFRALPTRRSAFPGDGRRSAGALRGSRGGLRDRGRPGVCVLRSPYWRFVDGDVRVEPLVAPVAAVRRELRSQARTLGVAVGLPVLLAAILVGAWLLVSPNTPDLAAQAYRSRLLEEVGFAVWDNNWYGGHHMPGYSLLYPWVALLLGMRLAGAFAVLVSTWAFERVVLPVYGAAARWGALCFALATAGDLWIGRLTFALGVAFAMLAVLAAMRQRGLLALLAAIACAASSPVAGLLLALAGVTHVLAERRLRPGLNLALPPLLLVLATQALFPEGGWEPFGAVSLLATLGVTLAFLWALPPEERLLRWGAALYLLATLLAVIPTPMGANAERYGVLLAAPMLLCGLSRSGWTSAHRSGSGELPGGSGELHGGRSWRRVGRWSAGRSRAVSALALCAMLVWVVWGPVVQTAGVQGDPSTHASFYAPLRRFLALHARSPVRIEVPFTRSHWEAALLAPYVPLARGWERQLDKRYNEAIEKNPLSPRVYRRWLERNAVSYVALANVPLDGSSIGEAALLRKGVPYLHEVLHTPDWRVFAVTHPTPLASAPGTLVRLGHNSFSVRFSAAGRSLVRVRYTPYWTLAAGAGCVREGAEGWTEVSAVRAGVVRLAARFSFGRALGLDGACS